MSSQPGMEQYDLATCGTTSRPGMTSRPFREVASLLLASLVPWRVVAVCLVEYRSNPAMDPDLLPTDSAAAIMLHATIPGAATIPSAMNIATDLPSTASATIPAAATMSPATNSGFTPVANSRATTLATTSPINPAANLPGTAPTTNISPAMNPANLPAAATNLPATAPAAANLPATAPAAANLPTTAPTTIPAAATNSPAMNPAADLPANMPTAATTTSPPVSCPATLTLPANPPANLASEKSPTDYHVRFEGNSSTRWDGKEVFVDKDWLESLYPPSSLREGKEVCLPYPGREWKGVLVDSSPISPVKKSSKLIAD